MDELCGDICMHVSLHYVCLGSRLTSCSPLEAASEAMREENRYKAQPLFRPLLLPIMRVGARTLALVAVLTVLSVLWYGSGMYSTSLGEQRWVNGPYSGKNSR